MAKSFMGKLLSAVAIGTLAASIFVGYEKTSRVSVEEMLMSKEIYDNEIGEVTESQEELEVSLMYMEVQAGTLNVRDKVMGNKISKVHKGDRFLIFGVDQGWYLILLDDEHAGWVCGKYVDVYYPDGNIYQLASAYNKTAEVNTLGVTLDPVSQAVTLAAQQSALEAQAQAEALAAQQAALEAQAQAEALAAQQAALEAQTQAEALAAQQAALAAQQAQLPSWATKDFASLNKDELIQWAIANCITPGMSQYDMCVAVNNFLCQHMTYDLNYYTTYDALKYGVGRCQGYANAFKDIMNTLGVPTDYVRGYGDGGRHGWNRVLIGGAYYYVDVTWNDSTGVNNWLMISEAQILQDHVITQYSASNTQ